MDWIVSCDWLVSTEDCDKLTQIEDYEESFQSKVEKVQLRLKVKIDQPKSNTQ